jgi:transcriptional regulator with XRE-family HTH domain
MQIAERLRGLRDSMGASVEEMAEAAHVSVEEYCELESGRVDIPVSALQRISLAYKVDLSALMYDNEPKMSSYFITRKDMGASVQRTEAYRYSSLAAGFMGRKADPFVVTVHPKPEDEPVYLNTHGGQEFNMVLQGRMLLRINGKDLTLEEGDSIYFNSELPHGMKALDGKMVVFLAVILS